MSNSMKNSYAANKTKHVSEKSSIIFWLNLGFVVLFLFWSGFQKALFNGNTFDFERPIYSSFVWVSISLFLLAFYFFSNWKLENNKDLLSLLVWLIPITYLIALLPAASNYNATNMINIQIMYAIFFILGIYLTSTQLGLTVIKISLISSAYFIVLFGMFHWLGNGSLIYSMVKWFINDGGSQTLYRDAVMEGPDGLRLTSVFQYANSYAAYLITVLICALYLIINSRKWYTIAINAIMLVPVILSFMLTLSRGAIVVLPIILLITMLFLKVHKQILMVLYLVLAAAASFIILGKITNAGEELYKNFSISLSLNSWLLILISGILLTTIIYVSQSYLSSLLEKKLQAFSKFKWAIFSIPAISIIVGIIGAYLLFNTHTISQFLPENIKNRIENINFAQNSVLERGTFYKDAIKVFKDYPLFGAGGGAWSALYEKYQNNPYVSRQAHNFFLQYLVEVGAVGLLVFLLFIISIFYLFIRSYIRKSADSRDSHFIFFIVTISLLIHSIIDFDLSFVYLGVLVFLCLGGMVSSIGDDPIKLKPQLKKPYVSKLYPSLLMVLSIIMFFTSVRMLSANSSFKESIAVSQKSTNYNDIIKPLNEAIKLHPNHPNYALQKIGINFQVYSQSKDEKFYNEAIQLLDGLKVAEPYNRQRIAQQINAFQIKGQYTQAAELAFSELSNFPWDITMYEDSIAFNVQAGIMEKNNKNTQAMNQNWDRAHEVYKSVLAKMKYLETLPKEQIQGRAFNVTNKIGLGISQINYYRGDYSAASTVLKPLLSDQLDDAQNRIVARWYLAALQKQKLNDQVLYEKLIAKDANEKQQIEGIVNMN